MKIVFRADDQADLTAQFWPKNRPIVTHDPGDFKALPVAAHVLR